MRTRIRSVMEFLLCGKSKLNVWYRIGSIRTVFPLIVSFLELFPSLNKFPWQQLNLCNKNYHCLVHYQLFLEIEDQGCQKQGSLQAFGPALTSQFSLTRFLAPTLQIALPYFQASWHPWRSIKESTNINNVFILNPTQSFTNFSRYFKYHNFEYFLSIKKETPQ